MFVVRVTAAGDQQKCGGGQGCCESQGGVAFHRAPASPFIVEFL
ncbi:hypothetical protein PAMC26510_10900 [Caballeronia sordidicola]|uniref:Uncharacterized protein n=1 Tax=Caballeronia sordidicola TaxID=196367 RepID=A0A242MZS5_CABSO|nr:hypothetical protein PAMC26510_10900 [Caballeronia sordidicola]